jgi:two-component system chemotaxis response regulator CheB
LIADQFAGPIFIVQHILPGFSSFLAESLSRHCGRSVVEASEGQAVEPDGIYLARAQSHMVLRRWQGAVAIAASDAPPENGCRPSADVLFRSAAAAYGTGLIACVMTGMGTDGAAGAVTVSRAGGYVIAQDESTSTVWGMPRAAVEMGIVNAVLPLDQIPIHLGKLSRKLA